MKWKLLYATGVQKAARDGFVQHFGAQLVATGVCFPGQVGHIGRPMFIQATETGIDTALNTLHNTKPSQTPDIVVLLIRRKDQALYSSFKYLADKKYCFRSICATQDNFQHRKGNGSMQQYMANVAMKANLKFAKINHTVTGVSNWLNNTMVLGADLTHPGGGAIDNCPSIAAIVSSTESTGGFFMGQLGLQDNSDMVQELFTAVQFALHKWKQRNKRLPQNILYYRDGVADSQYDQVDAEEVSAIRKAWSDYIRDYAQDTPNAELKLTTVIVTKRHSTRFFPAMKQDAMKKNHNCKPGPLVESAVTSPYYSDFYLQSHNAIKGTARPCHYFVLHNGMGISMTQLQELVSQDPR